jgi:hypothetical protein
MKLIRESPSGRSLRLSWEQQIRKNLTQNEGRAWKETDGEGPWEDKNRWRGLVTTPSHIK